VSSDRALLDDGYRRARAVTQAHSKSFSFASALLFGHRKRAAFALYAVCRGLDDAVDEGPPEGAPERLAAAREALGELFTRGPVDRPGLPWAFPVLLAFHDSAQRFGLTAAPLQELALGMEMDLTPRRYASWSELDLYCYRAAGTVGEAMAPILGCAQAPWATRAAADLGRAMQLTNIMRDVREDLGRGRVYLPQDELTAFGVSEGDLHAGRVSDGFVALMQLQTYRARALYSRGLQGIPALQHLGGRLTVRVMAAVYGGILGAIERARFDVFSARAHVPLRGKLALALSAVLNQEVPATPALEASS